MFSSKLGTCVIEASEFRMDLINHDSAIAQIIALTTAAADIDANGCHSDRLVPSR